MNVYDLIYVQLQLSLFRNEPVSRYSERELSCGQTLCCIQKKTILHTDFWNQNIPFKAALTPISSFGTFSIWDNTPKCKKSKSTHFLAISTYIPRKSIAVSKSTTSTTQTHKKNFKSQERNVSCNWQPYYKQWHSEVVNRRWHIIFIYKKQYITIMHDKTKSHVLAIQTEKNSSAMKTGRHSIVQSHQQFSNQDVWTFDAVRTVTVIMYRKNNKENENSLILIVLKLGLFADDCWKGEKGEK